MHKVEKKLFIEPEYCMGGDCLLRNAANDEYVTAQLRFVSANTNRHSGEYLLLRDDNLVGSIWFVTKSDGRVFILDTKNKTLNHVEKLKDIGTTLIGAVVQGLPSDCNVSLVSSVEALGFWKKLGFAANDAENPQNLDATVGEIHDKLHTRVGRPDLDFKKSN